MQRSTSVVVAMAMVALVALVCVCSAAPQPVDKLFDNFKARYNRNYAPGHEAMRKAIFATNLALAEQIAAQDSEAEFGVTQFMDLTPEEFRSTILMGNVNSSDPGIFDEPKAARDVADDAPPAGGAPGGVNQINFDWRNRGALTPIKNQGGCGSCWAFSAVETVESAWFLAKGTLPKLSPQQVISCDGSDWGCGGGWPATALQYVINNGGLQADTTYPYASANTACTADKSKIVATIKSYTFVSKQGALNEDGMQAALWNYGPLSVCLDATTWQYYKSGVLSSGCPFNSFEHCVQLTGWGQTSAGVKYWKLRNQWGATWGESGWIRIARGSNICGLANYAIRVSV